MNYDHIEYPKINKGKSYKDYLRDAGMKPYTKGGAPIITCRESKEVVNEDRFEFNA